MSGLFYNEGDFSEKKFSEKELKDIKKLCNLDIELAYRVKKYSKGEFKSSGGGMDMLVIVDRQVGYSSESGNWSASIDLNGNFWWSDRNTSEVPENLNSSILRALKELNLTLIDSPKKDF